MNVMVVLLYWLPATLMKVEFRASSLSAVNDVDTDARCWVGRGEGIIAQGRHVAAWLCQCLPSAGFYIIFLIENGRRSAPKVSLDEGPGSPSLDPPLVLYLSDHRYPYPVRLAVVRLGRVADSI